MIGGNEVRSVLSGGWLTDEGIEMRTIDDAYFECIRRFPLVELDDDSYDEAMGMLANLTNRQLTTGEREYRKLLEHLVKEYEKPYANNLNSVLPHELLAGLMKLHGLNQTQLAQILGCRQSFVSAILRAEKSISDETAIKLGKYFQVDPNEFRAKIQLTESA